MARWAYTVIMEGFGHGFSETMYLETGDDTIATAYAQIGDVKLARSKLLADGYHVKGDRLSMKLNTALQKVTNISQVREVFMPGTAAQVSISTGAAFKVLMVNAAATKKKLTFLGGGWEACNPVQNTFIPAGAWTTFFNSWVSKLIAAKMGWLSNSSPDPTPIIGYTFSPDTGHTTYTLSAALFAAPFPGKPVKVSVDFPGIKSPLDGPQVVIPLTATTAITAKPRPANVFVLPGRMRLYVPSFVGLATPAGDVPTGSVNVLKITGRKRGRPLLVSPGRAPVRDLW